MPKEHCCKDPHHSFNSLPSHPNLERPCSYDLPRSPQRANATRGPPLATFPLNERPNKETLRDRDTLVKRERKGIINPRPVTR